MQVLVLGYYGRKNLGDDVFEYIFTKYLKKRNLIPLVKNIDEIDCIPSNIGCVIFGGGDVINEAYINKIKYLIANSPIYNEKQIPVYALSVGIPYPHLIGKGYLDIFDYIVSRSKNDKIVMKERYNISPFSPYSRYSYAPDFSFLLSKFNKVKSKIKNTVKEPTKKIGIFLSQTIYNSKEPEAYDLICKSLVEFFTILLSKERKVFRFRTGLMKIPEYELHLYPSCTEDKDLHDDRIINKKIYMSLKHFENIKIHEDRIPIDEILDLFSSFDYTICTRFHAHLFSIMAEIPFLSISTSTKVENILNETRNTNLHVKMKTNPYSYCPLSLDVSDCLNKFKYMEDHYSMIKTSLEESHKVYTDKINKFTNKLDNLLFETPVYFPNHLNSLTYTKSNSIAETLSLHYTEDNYYLTDNKEEDELIDIILYKKGTILKYFEFVPKINIVQFISYTLTGNKDSVYNYGLCEQIFSPYYCLYDSIKWILTDIYKNIKGININLYNNIPFNERKIKIKNNGDFKGYHRSGWNYVLTHLEKYHNNNGIIFDSYLDRTFGWDNDCLSFAKVIPYTSSWIGIFHHTNNPNYSPYDLSHCINNVNFISSLPYCKGIIVLSKKNKEYMITETRRLGFNIPIIKLIHPTELQGFEVFNLNNFEISPVKKIIQIGAWLRNTYAIYDLKVPANYSKFALKGKNMDNYYIEDTEWTKMTETLKKIKGKDNASGLVVQDLYTNKYISGLIDSIQAERDSVTVLTEIDNHSYDFLLKNNIVFLCLIDAAAVNTIIECIVRNTPIVVNRVAAAEEYLGKDYPLFYENLEDVYKLIAEPRNIRNAHKYLKQLNKHRFSIEYFLSKFLKSSIYSNL